MNSSEISIKQPKINKHLRTRLIYVLSAFLLVDYDSGDSCTPLPKQETIPMMMETSCGQFVAIRPGFLPRARTAIISIRAHIFSYEVTVMTVKKTVMNRIKSDSYQVSPFMVPKSKGKRLLRNASTTRSGCKGCWFFLRKCCGLGLAMGLYCVMPHEVMVVIMK